MISTSTLYTFTVFSNTVGIQLKTLSGILLVMSMCAFLCMYVCNDQAGTQH